MSKKEKICPKLSKNHKKIGLLIVGIGVGVIITVVTPLWGFVIAVGCGLIYVGWYLMEHFHH